MGLSPYFIFPVSGDQLESSAPLSTVHFRRKPFISAYSVLFHLTCKVNKTEVKLKLTVGLAVSNMIIFFPFEIMLLSFKCRLFRNIPSRKTVVTPLWMKIFAFLSD